MTQSFFTVIIEPPAKVKFLFEETEEFSIYQIGHLTEVFRILTKLQIVTINDDEAPLVTLDPFFVTVVQALEIVDADTLLEVSASLLNVLDKCRDTALDVNHQVWELYQTNHQIEEIGIIIEIPIAHLTEVMKIRNEDAGILEDSTVLYDGLF